jgi:hypothetical protein
MNCLIKYNKIKCNEKLVANPGGPNGLRRGSEFARLLGFRYRIMREVRASGSCECRVLSVGGLCEGPIPRQEEFYRVDACL